MSEMLKCDRCGDICDLKAFYDRESEMVVDKLLVPEGWQRLTQKDGSTIDLCPSCSGKFRDFLRRSDGSMGLA